MAWKIRGASCHFQPSLHINYSWVDQYLDDKLGIRFVD